MRLDNDPFKEPHGSDRPFGWFFALVSGVAFLVVVHAITLSGADFQARALIGCISGLVTAIAAGVSLMLFTNSLAVVFAGGVITRSRATLGGMDVTKAPVDERGVVAILVELIPDSGGDLHVYPIEYEHPEGTVRLRKAKSLGAARTLAWRYALRLGVPLRDDSGPYPRHISIEEIETPYVETLRLDDLEWPESPGAGSRLTWDVQDDRVQIDVQPRGFDTGALAGLVMLAGGAGLALYMGAAIVDGVFDWWSALWATAGFASAVVGVLILFRAFFGKQRCWVNGRGVWSSDGEFVDVEDILYEGGDDPEVAVEFVTAKGTVGIGHGLPVGERVALRSVVLLALGGAL